MFLLLPDQRQGIGTYLQESFSLKLLRNVSTGQPLLCIFFFFDTDVFTPEYIQVEFHMSIFSGKIMVLDSIVPFDL